MKRRSEVCGPIGAGKSTLARILADNGWQVKHEDFHKNPFLDAFYLDPVANSFEAEICFLLQHYTMIKESPWGVVFDFSILQDLAYADLNLKGPKKRAFEQVAKVVVDHVGWPDALVVVGCETPILLERIRKRGRSYEQGISSSYLDDLSEAIEARVSDLPKNVSIRRVRSDELDYVSDGKDREQLMHMLGAFASIRKASSRR